MKIKTIFGLTLAAASLAACSVEDQDDSTAKVKEDYTRGFVKEFGTINANQDWSVVEQKQVTVKTATASDVKIYEKQAGEYRLAAHYANVQGSKTITFDGLEGDDTPFIVSVDGNLMAAANGETVDCSGATAQAKGVKRAAVYPDNSPVQRNSSAEKITLSTDDNIMETLSSDGENHTKTVTVAGTGYVEVLTGGESVSFYPMYWNSANTHTLGIYYYDNVTGKRTEIDIYKDHDSEDMAFYANQTAASWGTSNYHYTEAGQTNCWHYDATRTWDHSNGHWTANYFTGFKFYSHAYTVTPSQSVVCGLYVKVNGNTYYSQPELNDDKQAHFAYRTIGSGSDAYTYLCFDDPDTNDGDYNDLVFYSPRTIAPVSANDIAWTVACEDLGGTFDYDFNDLVFRVSHISGNTYATIVPLAAGGTLPATLYYGETAISKEWHQHFGNGYESNQMINTGGTSEDVVTPIQINGLPTDWSMKAFTSTDGGLQIKVDRTDGLQTSVTAPSKGEAPQMLVLPYEWQWPIELTRITLAYPDFGQWGENYTNSGWVSNSVPDNLMPAITTLNVKDTWTVSVK